MRYIKESEYDLYFILGLVVFVLSTYFAVPFIHELGHIVVLEYNDCKYWANLEYGFFKQFYGEIYQKCDLNEKRLLMVYAAGVIATFMVGFALLLIEFYLHQKHKIELAIPMLFVSYSFMLDFVNYLFFPSGDIKEVANMLGINTNLLPLLGMMFVILMLTYLYLNLSKELHSLIVEEEYLLKRIRKYIKSKLKAIRLLSKQ